MGDGCGLFKASFGAWALKSLTYVAHEPDAFNLDIEVEQSKSNQAGNGLGLSSEFDKVREQVQSAQSTAAGAVALSLAAILRMCP